MSDPATKSVIAELGPNMTVQDMRLQAKARLELASTIEAKYEGAITSADDEAQVKKLLAEVDILEDRIQALEEKESRSRRIQDGLDKYTRPMRPQQGKQGGDEARELSPGDQFTRDAAYLGLLHRGGFNSPLNALNFAVQMKDGTSLIQWTKALLYGSSDSVGGAWEGGPLRRPVARRAAGRSAG